MKYASILPIVLLFSIVPRPADELEIKNHLHGFRIERPEKTWTVREMDNPADGTFNVLLEPEGTPQGTVQVAVRVKKLDALVTAEQARDAALKSIADRSEIVIKKKRNLDVGDLEGAGVIAEMKAMGSTFRIELVYLVNEGRVYNLQRHAPSKDFAKYAPTFGRVWDSFGFVEVREDTSPTRRLRNLAARCGTEVTWNATWEEASRQARVLPDALQLA